MENKEIKKGKPFIVLDVEGMSTARPYNIGYIITDKYGNTYLERSFAILPCIWENLKNCLQAEEMTKKNVEEILSDIEDPFNRKYFYNSVEDAKKTILKDIIKFKVTEIWAYNCSFDKASLKRLFASDWDMLDGLVKFYDIIPAIVNTMLLNEDYVKWCKKNGYITEKGNVQTKAEIIYRYLTGEEEFIEDHTGLNDCKIEKYILLKAINSGKKIDRKLTTPAWKIFKQFCEAENIQI